MEQLRITAVKYYNTLPFIYGITQSGLLRNYSLSLDVPSECARKLITGEADLGLIPVGALSALSGYRIISELCIGARNDVQSVILLTNTELSSLNRIYLDEDSRTSVALVKILANELWHVNAEWVSLNDLTGPLRDGEGLVAIGDKTFALRLQYLYCYDLAGEWIRHTGLPFVFAVWVTSKQLPGQFLNNFDLALQWGVSHKKESAGLATNAAISEKELLDYLDKAIFYQLDEQMIKGMDLFLAKINKNQPFTG